MSLSGPFIRRPVGTLLMAAGLLLLGAVAYLDLPVAPLPQIDFPTIYVSASLPGASPQTMASAVATPLERRLGRIAGMSEITSRSSLGRTSIVMQFELDRDVDAAGRDVQAAINAASSELPANLPLRPRYHKVNPSNSPILVLSLSSPVLPLAQVYEAADTILAQKISRVAGVGLVHVAGSMQPAVRVQVDPLAAAALDLSLEDVRRALSRSTAHTPKGGFDGTRTAAAIAGNDQLLHAKDYADIVLRSAGEQVVRLRDVADVRDDVENDRAAAWMDGRRSVLVIVRREPGANIIETVARIEALLPELVSSVHPSMRLQVALDRSQTIKASVHDVERTLLLSVLLVTLVVYLFLGSLRSTLIPSVAVPLSLVGTFALMWALGFSLNNLSLMALTIATGFVVDDAIVVTENIARHIAAGRSPQTAAHRGAREIGFTVISITVSLLAAFIPLLWLGGLVGRLFREFALTLAIAISVSAVLSLTLTPMLCAKLLPALAAREPGRQRRFARVFVSIEAGYARALDWVLDHHRSMLLLTAGLVGLAVWLFHSVPKGLFPEQDTGLLIGSSVGPQDVSFWSMRDRQARVNAAVQHDPDVEHIMSFVGGHAANTGVVFVGLRSMPPRTDHVGAVIDRLRKGTAGVRGVKLFFRPVQDLRFGGRGSRTQFEYALKDPSFAELNTWAPRLQRALSKLPQLRDVTSDQQSAGLQLRFEIDRDTAARYGITPRQIDQSLYDAFGQRPVATLYDELIQHHVVLEVKPEFRSGPQALDNIYVRSAAGGLVALKLLGHARRGVLPLAVHHESQFPATTLSFNLAPGVTLGQAIAAIERVKAQLGCPQRLKAAFAGNAQVFAASLAEQKLLIAIAVLAVYLVLGVLYESYVHPFTILSTLPSAAVGALAALWLSRTELDVIAVVGIVLLIGIVKKNAIMMIDFAIEAQRTGALSAREAIARAACLRMRPILMTTLAALLGALPLALGSGLGSELRRPLGITIIGGLLASQALTVFTVPCVYLALDRFTRPRAQRKLALQAELDRGSGVRVPRA